jgi:hypothetical protein
MSCRARSTSAADRAAAGRLVAAGRPTAIGRPAVPGWLAAAGAGRPPGGSSAGSDSALSRSSGSALVIVLLGMAVLLSLTTAAVLLAVSDLRVASRQRDARLALAAAEAALERAAGEIVDAPDLSAVLSGAQLSARTDGAPSEARIVSGGRTLSPDQVAQLAACGSPDPCTPAARAAVTAERPWGLNNPWWRPYAYGSSDTAAPGAAAPYVVVLAADDPSENDGDPSRDGVAPGNPGAGIVLLRAEAFGPSGARRTIEAVVMRVTTDTGIALPRIIAWNEVR